MSTDGPSPDGVPVTWSPPPSDDVAAPAVGGNERRLGFTATMLADTVDLADDPEAIAAAIAAAEIPFNGAFVPVVIHDPQLAERSYDAAEWAAELIRAAGGRSLVAVPCAQSEQGPTPAVNRRHWNHAAAMIERLDGVCRRFGLELIVRDVVGGAEVRDDGILDPDRPIGHLLDAGRFLADGYQPVELAGPEVEGTEGGLIDRVRGLLRDRI